MSNTMMSRCEIVCIIELEDHAEMNASKIRSRFLNK